MTPYNDDPDAARIASNSVDGLGGLVWTSAPDHGRRAARAIQTGTVGINGYLPDPTAPFRGVKASGLGRELSPEVISVYQNVKSIYL